MALIISIKYLAMQGVSQQFEEQNARMKKAENEIRQAYQPCRSGGWVAESADDFYKTMEQEVFPALDRLNKALAKGAQTATQLANTMKKAEESAKSCVPTA